MTPATGSLRVGQRALERVEVGRAVGQRRQLVERQRPPSKYVRVVST